MRHGIDYAPQPGLQESVCASEHNLVFLCGQATSGKTYSMFLKALGGIDKLAFTARLISVRLQDSKKGGSIFRDGVEVLGKFANCEYNSSDYPTFAFPQWNSNLQLIHSNFNVDNPAEADAFRDYAKKQQASLIMVDEATEMKQFKMFSYWFSRNRDASGMTPMMMLSFNPQHEHWTTRILEDAGYLDEDGYYLRPEMIGKTKYFYIKGDDVDGIVWGDSREEVVEAAGLHDKPEDVEAGIFAKDYIKTFTVLTGTASGNRELVAATGGQSVANLHAVGATQRAIVGEAYFGPTDNSKSSVSRQMIDSLWSNPQNYDESLYASMDISAGGAGNDDAPMFFWRGNCVFAVEYYRGDEPITQWMARQLARYKVPYEHFVYDGTGMGYLLKDFTRGIPLVVNKAPIPEYDEYGNRIEIEQYTRLRSQLLSKLEAALKRGEICCSIPKDYPVPFGKKGQTRRFIDALADQKDVFIFDTVSGKKNALSKDEFKKKYKYSPNEIDALYLGMYFFLNPKERKAPKPANNKFTYTALYRRPKPRRPY